MEPNDQEFVIECKGAKLIITQEDLYYFISSIPMPKLAWAIGQLIHSNEHLRFLAENELRFNEIEEKDMYRYAKEGFFHGKNPPSKDYAEAYKANARLHGGIKKGWQLIIDSINQFEEYFNK